LHLKHWKTVGMRWQSYERNTQADTHVERDGTVLSEL